MVAEEKELYEFLVREGVLFAFMENLNADFSSYQMKQHRNIHSMCKRYKYAPREIITQAFRWGSTKEGDDFWRDIHYKWGKCVTKKHNAIGESLKENKENGRNRI